LGSLRFAKQKTACIVAPRVLVIHTNRRFQPRKIKDLFMFPEFTRRPRKAVDKGNHEALDKPGQKPGTNPSVGNSPPCAHPSHNNRTTGTPITDRLSRHVKPDGTGLARMYPQAAAALAAC